MKNFAKYVFVVAGIAAFMMVVSPVAKAATGVWTPITGSARSSDTDGKSGHFEILNDGGQNFIYALGKTGGGVFKWDRDISHTNPSAGGWVSVTGGGGTDVFTRGPDNKFYVLGENGGVFRWDGGSAGWTSVTGDAARTSNLNNKSGHFEIFNNYIYALGGVGNIAKWNRSITDANPLGSGSGWENIVDTGAVDVFKFGPDGKLYAMLGAGAVARWDGASTGWTRVTRDGARTTDNFGKSGHFEIIDGFIYALGGPGNITKWNRSITDANPLGSGSGWENIVDTGVVDIFKKGPDGKFYALTANGAVFRRDETTGGTPCDTSYPADKFHVCFFDGITFTSATALAQADTQTLSSPVDSATAFNNNWGSGPVGGTAKSDLVSAIWRGSIKFRAGPYTFHTLSDDGVELIIDGNSVINDMSVHAAKQDNYTTSFSTEGYHNVTLKWFEQEGAAVIILWWDYTGGGAAITIVSPNGGEIWQKGTTHTITWISSNLSSSAFVTIVLRNLRTDGSSTDYALASDTPNDGAEAVTIPTSIPDGSYKVQVKTAISPGVVVDDWSDAPFTIQPIGTNTPPFGFIDPLADPVSGTVTVIGWAADKEGPIATGDIKLKVDGANLTITPTRVNRTDVCESSGVLAQLELTNDNAGKSQCNTKQPLGVQFNWNTTSPPLSNGSHIIAFVLADSAGTTATVGTRTVTVSGGTTGPFTLTISKSGSTGQGTVTSTAAGSTDGTGINCGPSCSIASKTYASGSSVTVTASPASGSTFAGWSGDCASTGNSCGPFTMTSARSVTATFNTSGGGNNAPIANVGAGHNNIPVGTPHTHSGAFATDNEGLASYRWEWWSSTTCPSSGCPSLSNNSGTLSGASATVSGPTYTATQPGDYSLKLIVTDTGNLTAEARLNEVVISTGGNPCTGAIGVIAELCALIDQLQAQLAALLGGTTLNINDQVQSTVACDPVTGAGGLRIRSTANGSLTGSKVCAGEKGLITAGPTDEGGFRWWQVDWDSALPTGWSAQGPTEAPYLEKVSGGGGGGGGAATLRIAPSKINSYYRWSPKGDSYEEISYTYALYDPDGPAGPEPERSLFPSEVTWTGGDPHLNLQSGSNAKNHPGAVWAAYAGTIDQNGIPSPNIAVQQPYDTTITASYNGMIKSIPFNMNVGRRPGSERPYYWVSTPGKFFSGLPYVPQDNNAITANDPLARDPHFEMTVKAGETKTYPIKIATGFGDELEDLSGGITNLLGNLNFNCHWGSGPGGITCDDRYRITGVAPGRTYIYHPGTFTDSALTVTRVTVTPP